MAKVVITGANGFLGSWLTRDLLRQGHDVRIVVREKSDLSELEGLDCPRHIGDVTDLASLNKAFQGAELAYHLAGVVAYDKNSRPLMDKVNVHGTKNVVHAVLKNNCRRLVYLSSVTAVGAGFSPDQILNENSTYNLSHLNLGYFESKHQAEILVREACLRDGLDAVTLCPSTIYGRGDAKKGSRKMQIKVAQGKMKFYTHGGVSVVAVEDVVQGICSAAQNGKSGERYILSGENLLIKDLFRIIAEIAGVQTPSFAIPNGILHAIGKLDDLLRPHNIKMPVTSENAYAATLYHWFDCSKAKQELAFNPRPAHEAIQNSVQWMMDEGLVKPHSL